MEHNAIVVAGTNAVTMTAARDRAVSLFGSTCLGVSRPTRRGLNMLQAFLVAPGGETANSPLWVKLQHLRSTYLAYLDGLADVSYHPVTFPVRGDHQGFDALPPYVQVALARVGEIITHLFDPTPAVDVADMLDDDLTFELELESADWVALQAAISRRYPIVWASVPAFATLRELAALLTADHVAGPPRANNPGRARPAGKGGGGKGRRGRGRGR